MSTKNPTHPLLRQHPHLHLPITVSAPLRPFALSPLATATTLAGGLGFLSSTPNDAAELSSCRHTLLPSAPSVPHPPPAPPSIPQSSHAPNPSPTDTDAILSDLSARPLPDTPVQVGIGYQIYFTPLATALRDITHYLPAAAWLFAWSSVEQVGVWARAIHKATGGRTAVWVQVGTVGVGLEVMRVCCGGGAEGGGGGGGKWIGGGKEIGGGSESGKGGKLPPVGVDKIVLVAQGSDAGGHQLQRSASLMTLLPELLDALSREGYGEVPVLGAGGVLDARGAAAALTLGAAGVVLGTRLAGARELSIPDGFREHVLGARDGGESTVATRLFDRLRGTGDFPEGWYGRALVNRSWRDVEGGVDEGEVDRRYKGFMERQAEGKTDEEAYGDEGTLVVYAGTGVGLVRETVSAGEIVKEIREGVKGVMEKARESLGG